MEVRREADVLVVGAGMAGLAAARKLAESGRRVIVLEARGRIGGRVHTASWSHGEGPVELGAEFIHGRPESTLKLAAEAGAHIASFGNDHWYWIPDRGFENRDDFFSQVDGLMEDLANERGQVDSSFASFLARWSGTHPNQPDAVQMARSFVEGFHAAPADDVSARSLVEEAEGGADLDDNSRVKEGYAALAARLHQAATNAGAEVLLNHRVQLVRWHIGRAEVEAVAASGATLRFTAPHAIITLPVGVLQTPAGEVGHVVFEPELPETTRMALRNLALGPAIRVILKFGQAFWQSCALPGAEGRLLRDATFLHAQGTDFPTWWTHHPEEDAVLTAWAGGPAAARLSSLPDDAIGSRALHCLAMMMHLPPETIHAAVEELRVANWQTDPYSRGAYSYLRVGGEGAREVLGAPIADTLYFAGEATAPAGEDGTVAGALMSGERAAAKILSRRQRS